jgi:hypothetical protein
MMGNGMILNGILYKPALFYRLYMLYTEFVQSSTTGSIAVAM